MSVTFLDWQQRARCVGADPELFFPENDEARAADAKAICATCPVTAACMQLARAIGAQDGIWGGVDLGPQLCGNRLHVMTEANTKTRTDGTKCCRACRLATDKRYRLRKQEEEQAA